jgi:hypothetical protein
MGQCSENKFPLNQKTLRKVSKVADDLLPIFSEIDPCRSVGIFVDLPIPESWISLSLYVPKTKSPEK